MKIRFVLKRRKQIFFSCRIETFFYQIRKNRRDPRIRSVRIVVFTIDQFVRRSNVVVRRRIQRVDAVRMSSDVFTEMKISFSFRFFEFSSKEQTLRRQNDFLAVFVEKLETGQTDIVTIAVGRMKLKFINDF